MNQIKYELHNDLNPDFPLIFGHRSLSANHANDIYVNGKYFPAKNGNYFPAVSGK